LVCELNVKLSKPPLRTTLVAPRSDCPSTTLPVSGAEVMIGVSSAPVTLKLSDVVVIPPTLSVAVKMKASVPD
jgi:hypothetical protein